MMLGIDVGGTFTDVVLVDDSGAMTTTKVFTTPGEYSAGILRGVKDVLLQRGGRPADVARFIYSSTVATNAVIEQKGAVTAALTTEGFEDVLEIGRQKRSRLYDLFIDAETPTFLAPRRVRAGIRERVDASGRVLIPLDEQQLRERVARLVDQYGVEAVAVCYLFSFLNPEHERRTKEIIEREFPNVAVSVSSDVDPVFREYERLCVTALDAYLRPIVSRHLEDLAGMLNREGLSAELEVMQSRGGICTFSHIVALPARMVASGPAAGVLGGVFVATQAGYSDIISLDMGGTSADIAVVKNGEVLTTTEGKIFSYPFRLPMVDVSSIGAGGGSMAWIDAAGSLHVGPESAGALPGPACYGRGGTAPTVTDASVVLGYLNPRYFAGGVMNLDADAAQRAVGGVAQQLGLSLHEAAWAIHAIVNAKMADEIHLWTVCRGFDPREFALVLLGGAGPVNGGMVAKSLSIASLLIPMTPGVLAAFGALVANIEHDHSASFRLPASAVTWDSMANVFRELDEKGYASMERDRVPAGEVRVVRSADLRYSGQSYELNVVLSADAGEKAIAQLLQDFHARHRQVYGQASEADSVEFVSLRAVHSYPLPKPASPPPPYGASWEAAQKGTRVAYFFPHFPDGVEVPVYARSQLPGGSPAMGPLIIEQSDTTTVVYPGQSCQVDRLGNLILTNPVSES